MLESYKDFASVCQDLVELRGLKDPPKILQRSESNFKISWNEFLAYDIKNDKIIHIPFLKNASDNERGPESQTFSQEEIQKANREEIIGRAKKSKVRLEGFKEI